MREAVLGVAVGKKGIGKTYTTLQMIQKYVNEVAKDLKVKGLL